MKQYKTVKNINFDTNGPDLSLFLYCNKNTKIKDIEPVFITVKHYLFDNPSGSNPSQQSFVKRGNGKYTQIIIAFYTANTENVIVSYESGYYTDGLQDKIDNFTTWHIDQNGEESQMTLK